MQFIAKDANFMQIAKKLIRLRGCIDWSLSLLHCKFFFVPAQIDFRCYSFVPGIVACFFFILFSQKNLCKDILTWARSCENVSYAICEQQRCRSACASAQSDQHLYCSLLRLYDMYTCFIQRFKILVSLCS